MQDHPINVRRCPVDAAEMRSAWPGRRRSGRPTALEALGARQRAVEAYREAVALGGGVLTRLRFAQALANRSVLSGYERVACDSQSLAP
jgi:hypothetical protein